MEPLKRGDYEGAARQFGISEEEIKEMKFNSDFNLDGRLQEDEQQAFLQQLATKMFKAQSNKDPEAASSENIKKASDGNLGKTAKMGEDIMNSRSVTLGVTAIVGLVIGYVFWRKSQQSTAASSKRVGNEVRDAWNAKQQQQVQQTQQQQQQKQKGQQVSTLTDRSAEHAVNAGASAAEEATEHKLKPKSSHSEKLLVEKPQRKKNEAKQTSDSGLQDTVRECLSTKLSQGVQQETNIVQHPMDQLLGDTEQIHGEDKEQSINEVKNQNEIDTRQELADKEVLLSISVEEDQATKSCSNVVVSKDMEVKENTPENKSKEELFMDAVSHLLDVTVELKSSSNRFKLPDLNTLTIELKEICLGDSDDFHGNASALFNRRLMRIFVDKVKFCIECYERSCCYISGETYLEKLATGFRKASVNGVLKQLIEGMGALEEDDLYAGFSAGEQSTGYMFLSRLTGFGGDGVLISDGLLREVLCQAAESEQGGAAISGLITVVSERVMKVKRYDEILITERNVLTALEIVVKQREFGKVLALIFRREIKESRSSLGAFFEQSAAFAKLLRISCLPLYKPQTPLKLEMAVCKPYLELQGFPKPRADDLKRVESHIQQGLQQIQQVVHTAIYSLLKTDKEAALGWLASIIVQNETREIVRQPIDTQIVCSDGYMVNLCSVLLKLCEPFCRDDVKLDKISPSYSSSKCCRLNYDEDCLASSKIVSDGTHNSCLLPPELEGTYNFITESFHLTQRALHVGLLPAISSMVEIQKALTYTKDAKQGTGQEEDIQKQLVLVTLLYDCCLIDYDVVYQTTQFYLRQASWYLKLLADCSSESQLNDAIKKKQQKLFSTLPEFPVRDMCVWLRFVVYSCVPVRPTVLKTLPVPVFVDCCVTFLRRSDIVTGPVTACKIVSALLAFVNSGKRKDSQFGDSMVMSDLAAMVHMNPAVQQYLGPVLIELYTRVNVVEGQDIDRDEFDKYSARQEMGQLLESLWMHHDCRTSVLKATHTKPFQEFLGAVLDTLLYQYHDSLARLANVRKTQDLMANESEWNKMSSKEKADNENFLRGEERVAKGFMSMTKKTLQLLEMMSKNESVAEQFTKQPLAQRAASSIIGFLESLCGRKNVELKVKNMSKYNFNPEELLTIIIQLILRIAVQESSADDGFVISMAKDADFNPITMNKSGEVVQRKGLGNEEMQESWAQLLQKLLDLHSSSTSSTIDGATDSAKLLEEQLYNITVDANLLEQEYIEQMADLKFSATELQEDHYYRNKADEALDPRSPKIKALIKEAKMIHENLPLHPNAAIFVVQDEDRMDIVRTVITGPTDTPYSRGCFAFDIYFPDQYPNVPPLVQFITTGGKLVRFNPNLYADGKVCLSLLGTWHGSSAAEKWNPKTSTLYQVLVSIQSMILISDPMFNEPGYEGRKSTTEGMEESEKYNYPLWLHNVRHAMLGQLRNPPTGCKDIIRRHFWLQRNAVLKQCSDWLARCQDADIKRRLLLEVKDLNDILSSLNGDEEDSIYQP